MGSAPAPRSIAIGSAPAEPKANEIVGPLPRVSLRLQGASPSVEPPFGQAWPGASCCHRCRHAAWAVPTFQTRVVAATTVVHVAAVQADGIAVLVIKHRILAACTSTRKFASGSLAHWRTI